MNKDYDEHMVFSLGHGVKFIPENRCMITRAGRVIELSENSHRFLLLLLEGETDKQNIINQVWYEQRGSVTDSSYYGQIYMLRKALDLAGLSGSLIKTIPRKGVKYMGTFYKEMNKIVDNQEELADEYNEILPLDIPVLESESLIKEDLPVDLLLSQDSNKAGAEWYNSRHWNILISVLAMLAVCWLTTLAVMVVILLQQ